MYNYLNEQELKKLNKLLQDTVSNNTGVNFISYVTSSEGKKCSLVLKQDEKADSVGYVNDQKPPKEISNDNDFYYGLHPVISSTQMIKEIKNGSFKNLQSLKKAMNKMSSNAIGPVFKLHKNQEEYLECLFAATILKMSNNFGIVCYCNEYETIKNELKRIENSALYVAFSDEKKEIIFLSGFSDYILSILKSLNLGYEIRDDKLYILKGTCNFDQIYEPSNIDLSRFIKLVKGAIYYSGVMPRTKLINHITSIYNPDIETYQFIVERTTFATLDVFDNGGIIAHDILKDYYDKLKEMFLNEDHAQESLLKEYATQSELLENINKYLSISMNTHTIAVTGNIETSDNLLVLCERGKNTIDSNEYYPSVNGQSEFKDIHPDIYKESVYEDYPTLDYTNDYRLDFSGEINREAFAELNVQLLESGMQYYGFSFLLIKDTGDIHQKRRMHFNILSRIYTKENLESIIESRKYATEKFENSDVIGLSIKKRGMFTENLYQLVSIAFHHIEMIATIIIGCMIVLEIYQNGMAISADIKQILVDNIIPITLAICVGIVVCKKIIQVCIYFKKMHKQIKVLYHSEFKVHDMDTINKFINNVNQPSGKSRARLHAVTLLTSCLYFIYKDQEKR